MLVDVLYTWKRDEEPERMNTVNGMFQIEDADEGTTIYERTEQQIRKELGRFKLDLVCIHQIVLIPESN